MSTSPSTALLVIDVQQGLFGKGTPIYQADALLQRLNALIDRARAAGVPVVYVQHNSAKVLPYRSPEWQLHPALRPPQDALVVDKTHGNAFEDTPLGAALQAQGVHSVIVTGLVSHGCVRATALGALDLGYSVTLVADGHSSYAKDAAKKVEDVNAQCSARGVALVAAEDVTFG